MGWWKCEASSCGVSAGVQRGVTFGQRSAFLTDFSTTGHSVSFPFTDGKHANGLVFMENDARFFGAGDGYEDALEDCSEDVDVTFGFAAHGPLKYKPHVSVSYVTDAPQAFRSVPVDFDSKVRKVVWVSSQCDPHFASERLARVDALVPRLRATGDWLSLGACGKTADMAATFPMCARLDTDVRAGGAATVDTDPLKRCASLDIRPASRAPGSCDWDRQSVPLCPVQGSTSAPSETRVSKNVGTRTRRSSSRMRIPRRPGT